MAYRAAHDAAQHVAAAFIAGNHAIDDQERAGAYVIGDDFQRIIAEVFAFCFTRCRLGQVLKQIDFVVRMHVLQYRRNAFQSHAGIDRWFGQRMQLAVVVAVELHEHEVPDFNVAVAVGFRRAGRSTRDIGTVVVKNLAARAAGAGFAHLPEVVGTAARLVADARDALARHADLVGPQVIRFVVGLVDRHPQLFFRQLVDRRQQFPRVMNRVFLEIITERKIAEHFKKRVVARGIADVFQVIVLAAGAHAALRGGSALVGTLLLAEKHVLELHHAGIGKKQRRIVAGHERAGRHDGVALGFKVIEKLLADFTAVHDCTGRRKTLILNETRGMGRRAQTIRHRRR